MSLLIEQPDGIKKKQLFNECQTKPVNIEAMNFQEMKQWRKK
jgi:hypothetical protein